VGSEAGASGDEVGLRCGAFRARINFDCASRSAAHPNVLQCISIEIPTPQTQKYQSLKEVDFGVSDFG